MIVASRIQNISITLTRGDRALFFLLLLLQGKKKKPAAIELNIGGDLLVCSCETLKQAPPSALLRGVVMRSG
jgi:hypothetical protein